MPNKSPTANSTKSELTQPLLVEKLRILTNYWVVPTIIIIWLLFKLLFAFLGNYLEFVKADLPVSGILSAFLLYVLVSGRYILKYARNLFGLSDDSECPLRSLFVSQNAFEKYREKVLSIIFKKEVLVSIGIAVFWLAITSFSDILREVLGKPYGSEQSESIIALTDYLVTIKLFGFFGVFLFGSIIWAIIGMLRSVYALGSTKDLALTEYVNNLKPLTELEQPDSEETKLNSGAFSYEQFHRKVQEIGRFCFTVSLLLLGGSVLVGIWVAGSYLFYGFDPIRVVLLISTVLGSFLFFIIPQVSLHQFLKNAKKTILDYYKDTYAAAKNSYLQREGIISLRTSEEELISAKDFDRMVRKIEMMKIIVSETEKISTWPYDLSQLLQLLGSGLIPFIPFLIDLIVSTLGR